MGWWLAKKGKHNTFQAVKRRKITCFKVLHQEINKTINNVNGQKEQKHLIIKFKSHLKSEGGKRLASLKTFLLSLREELKIDTPLVDFSIDIS